MIHAAKEGTAAGSERLRRIREALANRGLDALVCSLPHNVLLATGYWPVTARSVAAVHVQGQCALIVPEDELRFAKRGWIDAIVPFTPSARKRGSHDIEAIKCALSSAIADWHPVRALGFEDGPSMVPTPYAALCVFGPSYLDLIASVWPNSKLERAGEMLAEQRTRPTNFELSRIRTACRVASRAFLRGYRSLHAGLRETAVAHRFSRGLSTLSHAAESVNRAGGFVYCMSGPNAGRADASYQHSTARKVQCGESILIHCNSFLDGYWTDIGRTFCLGTPGERLRAALVAVLAARDAALSTVRAGTPTSIVDATARKSLAEHGFGSYVRHAVGHGVGFAAIDHDAPPLLSSDSKDLLEAGMVMNIEPGIYGPDIGGVRHCELVCVTREGYELLTPFLSQLRELILPENARSPNNRCPAMEY